MKSSSTFSSVLSAIVITVVTSVLTTDFGKRKTAWFIKHLGKNRDSATVGPR